MCRPGSFKRTWAEAACTCRRRLAQRKAKRGSAQLIALQVGGGIIGLLLDRGREKTIRAPLAPGAGKLLQQAPGAGVILACQQDTAREDIVRKGGERLVEIGRRRVAIGVVVLHVGHHGNRRVQPEEHTIVLIRLDDEEIALAGMGVAAQVQCMAADDVGRVDPQTRQHPGDHRGRGGLSMRARHSDDAVAPEQIAQETIALVNRDTGGLRGDNFRIAIRDG